MAPSISFSVAFTLILDLLVFAVVYLTASPLTGAVNAADLSTMEYAFAGIKVVSPVVGLLLRYERFVLSLKAWKPVGKNANRVA